MKNFERFLCFIRNSFLLQQKILVCYIRHCRKNILFYKFQLQSITMSEIQTEGTCYRKKKYLQFSNSFGKLFAAVGSIFQTRRENKNLTSYLFKNTGVTCVTGVM